MSTKKLEYICDGCGKTSTDISEWFSVTRSMTEGADRALHSLRAQTQDARSQPRAVAVGGVAKEEERWL